MRDYPTLYFNTIMNRLMKPLAIGKYLEFNTIMNRLMKPLAIGKYLEFLTLS